MGIPAFYGWLSQKYSRIAKKELPEGGLDNLYLDVNALIHGACQGDDGEYMDDEAKMLERVVAYIEAVLELTKAKKLVYVAVDGVAPRAKLNQQRGRRFQSAKTRLEDQAQYETAGIFDDDDDEDNPDQLAVKETKAELAEVRDKLSLGIFANSNMYDDDTDSNSPGSNQGSDDGFLNGLFGGDASPDPEPTKAPWDSNAITPGTVFMEKVSCRLKAWAEAAVQKSPSLTVIVSDSNTPGEGEHKFVDYLRAERASPTSPSFDPNESHGIVSLDADIILLSLSLHLPNVYVVREDRRSKPMEKFEYCYIDNLREHLAEELCGRVVKYRETYLDSVSADGTPKKKLGETVGPQPCFEAMLSDFILMCTLAGNDFVPHLPSVYVGQLSGDVMLDIYARAMAVGYLKSNPRSRSYPYLIDPDSNHGSINLENLEAFLDMYSVAEDSLFRQDAIFEGRITDTELSKAAGQRSSIDETWRREYYASIIAVAPSTAGRSEEGLEQRRAMAEAWLEGLVWVNHYYNNPGTISWSWYYKYYHSPFAADVVDYLKGHRRAIVDIEARLAEPSAPLAPKHQLLSVLPTSSFAGLLPKSVYEPITQNPDLLRMYPSSWRLDLTGCRAEYHGVPLLPFLDVPAVVQAAGPQTPPSTNDVVFGVRGFSAHEVVPVESGAWSVIRQKPVPGSHLNRRWHPRAQYPEVVSVDLPEYIPWRPGARGGRVTVTRVVCGLVALGLLRRMLKKREYVGLAMVLGIGLVFWLLDRKVPEKAPPRVKGRRKKCKLACTAAEFLKPKRCRADWVCRHCIAKNYERLEACHRCGAPFDGTNLTVFLPKSNRWSTSCYTADHRPHTFEQ